VLLIVARVFSHRHERRRWPWQSGWLRKLFGGTAQRLTVSSEFSLENFEPAFSKSAHPEHGKLCVVYDIADALKSLVI
jgi:hypothetical protein